MNNHIEFRRIRSSFEYDCKEFLDKIEDLLLKLEAENEALKERNEWLEVQLKDSDK